MVLYVKIPISLGLRFAPLVKGSIPAFQNSIRRKMYAGSKLVNCMKFGIHVYIWHIQMGLSSLRNIFDFSSWIDSILKHI